MGYAGSDWEQLRLERSELNKLRAAREVEFKPVQGCISYTCWLYLLRGILCETVSKALLRSRRMRMDNSPESAAMTRSWTILFNAVLVL